MCKLISLLLVFIFPLAALADGPPFLDINKFTLDGKTYVGFVEPDAQTLLQYRIDIPKLKLEIKEFKDIVIIKNAEIGILTSANATLLETKEFLTTENVRLQGEITNQAAWYKSPYFFFCIGLLSGFGATVAMIYAVN